MHLSVVSTTVGIGGRATLRKLTEFGFPWYAGFLLEKNLRGQKTIDHCFKKQQTIVSLVLSIVFPKILGGQKSFGGCPPCSRKPGYVEINH